MSRLISRAEVTGYFRATPPVVTMLEGRGVGAHRRRSAESGGLVEFVYVPQCLHWDYDPRSDPLSFGPHRSGASEAPVPTPPDVKLGDQKEVSKALPCRAGVSENDGSAESLAKGRLPSFGACRKPTAFHPSGISRLLRRPYGSLHVGLSDTGLGQYLGGREAVTAGN